METQIAIPNNRLHNADSSRVNNVHTFYSQLQRLRTKIIYIAYDRDFHKIAIENIKKKKADRLEYAAHVRARDRRYRLRSSPFGFTISRIAERKDFPIRASSRLTSDRPIARIE